MRKAIREANRNYYVLDRPTLSDAAYDRLLRELKELEGQFPELSTEDSPTRRVGAPVEGPFRTHRHHEPMLSLNNAFSADEMREFDGRVRRGLDLGADAGPVEYTVEPKYDGVSASLVYERGRLTVGATRGDGTVGEDVTAQIRTIRAVPLVLEAPAGELPQRIEIRGEVILPLQRFAAVNGEQEENGLPRFANPRNAAAGSLRQLDPAITARRRLEFIGWGVGAVQGRRFVSHTEILETLKTWGIPVSREVRVCRGIEEAIAARAAMEAQRDEMAYELDGVVVKVNLLEQRDRLGKTARHPRWAMAFKFAPRQETTRVKDIVVQVGRTGILTPVALLEPAKIGGVTVSRATLHTAGEVEAKDVRVGDIVFVQRAGDVIPEVVAVVTEKRSGREKKFRMPSRCPRCGGDVEEVGAYTYCLNSSCPDQVRGRILHLTSRQAFDITGLGTKKVDQLLEAGILAEIPDVFTLREKRDALTKLERWEEKSVSNLLDEIERARKVSFQRFLVALSIPGVGVTVARLLAESLATLEELRGADEEALQGIDGIGPELARSVVHFFTEKHNWINIERMLKAGVEIVYTQKLSDDLAGKTFVLTGSLESLTREEAAGAITERGGRVTSSVSKKTDYVIVGANPGSKADKAAKLKVATLDESGFRKLLGLE